MQNTMGLICVEIKVRRLSCKSCSSDGWRDWTDVEYVNGAFFVKAIADRGTSNEVWRTYSSLF